MELHSHLPFKWKLIGENCSLKGEKQKLKNKIAKMSIIETKRSNTLAKRRKARQEEQNRS